jgi:hypothetical protein
MNELTALAGLKGIGHPLGEPAAVWAVARGFIAAADTLDRSAKRLGATVAMLERQRGWSGPASNAFVTRCQEYQKQLKTASETFREVVVALTAYAARLEAAQTMVDDAQRSVLLAAGAAPVIPVPDLNWLVRQADMAITEVRAASLVTATELRALANRAVPMPGPVRRRPGPTRHATGGIFGTGAPRVPTAAEPSSRTQSGPAPAGGDPPAGAAAPGGDHSAGREDPRPCQTVHQPSARDAATGQEG